MPHTLLHWVHLNSRERSPPPSLVPSPPSTSLSEVARHACSPEVGIWRQLPKTGRYPKRTQKDGDRGSGSPLTRACSKLLLIASLPQLPAPGHTVLALIFDGRQRRADSLSRINSPSPLLTLCLILCLVLRSLGIVCRSMQDPGSSVGNQISSPDSDPIEPPRERSTVISH